MRIENNCMFNHTGRYKKINAYDFQVWMPWIRNKKYLLMCNSLAVNNKKNALRCFKIQA